MTQSNLRKGQRNIQFQHPHRMNGKIGVPGEKRISQTQLVPNTIDQKVKM